MKTHLSTATMLALLATASSAEGAPLVNLPGSPAKVPAVCTAAGPKTAKPRAKGDCAACWKEFNALVADNNSRLDEDFSRETEREALDRLQVLITKVRGRCKDTDTSAIDAYKFRTQLQLNAVRKYKGVSAVKKILDDPHTQMTAGEQVKDRLRTNMYNSAAECALIFRQLEPQAIMPKLVAVAERCEGWARAHAGVDRPSSECAASIADFNSVLEETASYLDRVGPDDLAVEWRRLRSPKLTRGERTLRDRCQGKVYLLLKQLAQSAWLQRKGAALEAHARMVEATRRIKEMERNKQKASPLIVQTPAMSCLREINMVTCIDRTMARARDECSRALVP